MVGGEKLLITLTMGILGYASKASTSLYLLLFILRNVTKYPRCKCYSYYYNLIDISYFVNNEKNI